jgi:response regulator of citrate/malate metabolism
MIRTLIIEDDFRVAEINAAYIQMVDGYKVIGVAPTAAIGYQLVIDEKPDLVLLDLYLPDEHGLELFSRLQRFPRGSKPDVFIITAAKDTQSLKDAIQLGAAAYLVKPFNGQELIERLKAYKSAHELLSTEGDISQAEVNAAVALMRGGKVEARGETASSNPTTAIIIKCLKNNIEPMSASEIAVRLGISRATSQRYLSQLVDRELVMLELQYGTAGRPINKYRLAK